MCKCTQGKRIQDILKLGALANAPNLLPHFFFHISIISFCVDDEYTQNLTINYVLLYLLHCCYSLLLK